MYKVLALTVAAFLAAPVLEAQVAQQGKDSVKAAKKEHRRERARAAAADSSSTTPVVGRLFTSTDVLPLTLVANFGRLKRDRETIPPYHWAELTVPSADGGTAKIPVEVRARGIWRRKNCDIPPIRLHFNKEAVKHTEFAKQKNVKLTLHCRDNDTYEQYILMEYQLYRVYNVLTPMSHFARLARVTYVDSASGKPIATRYAFLLEDVDDVAARNHMIVAKQKGANPGDLDPANDALVGLFEYLIGNTDFSIAALHNYELFQRDTAYFGVAHDFDWAGAVNTRYAIPDSRLAIRTVRQRIYRGYCVPQSYFEQAIATFDAKKDAIYALYQDQLGSLLTPDNRKSTLEYFDDFYRTIDDRHRAKREIMDACLGSH